MALILYYLIGLISFTVLSLLFRVFFLLSFYPAFSVLTLTQQLYALLWGLQFDLAIAAFLCLGGAIITYLGCRFTSIRKPFAYLSVLGVCFIALSMSADIMYFADSGRHITYEAANVGGGDAWSLISTAFGEHVLLSWGTLIIIALMCVLMIFMVKRWVNYPKKNASIKSLEIPLVIIAVFSIIAFRGGPTRPVRLAPYNAYAIGNSKQALLTLNGAFNTLFYLRNGRFTVHPVPLPLQSKQQEKAGLAALYPAPLLPLQLNSLKHYNVVVLLLESWQAHWMTGYGSTQPTTPYFAALRSKTFSAPGMIANGHRTPEGLFATFCSSQNPLGQSVGGSQLAFAHYQCLPKLLRDKGFSTAFFQATDKALAQTGSLAHVVGFTDSYGRMDIKKSLRQPQYPQNRWGYQDPDEYAFILNNLQKRHQPFLVGINTTSTHDDILPPGVKAIFPNDSDAHGRQNTLHFADAALHDFLKNYQKKQWKYPTLFIIEADHTAGLTNVSDAEQYYIPFLMFSSDGKIPPTHLSHMVSQRDIAPTIIDFLGGHVPWFTGKSMLSQHYPPDHADFYYSGSLGWFNGDRLVEENLTTQKLSCYLWKNNMGLTINTPCKTEDQQQALLALAFTRYNQRLLFKQKLASFYPH